MSAVRRAASAKQTEHQLWTSSRKLQTYEAAQGKANNMCSTACDFGRDKMGKRVDGVVHGEGEGFLESRVPREIDEDNVVFFSEERGKTGEFYVARSESMKEDDRRVGGAIIVRVRIWRDGYKRSQFLSLELDIWENIILFFEKEGKADGCDFWPYFALSNNSETAYLP
jgi:hypothetical protein